jgi:hypothetical protein
LAEQHDMIVQALEPLKAVIDGLQVYGWQNGNPTPPSLDVRPGDPFLLGAGMGLDRQAFWNVRARISTADQDAQALLLRLLDTGDPASVEAALDAIDVGVGLDGYVTGFRDDTDGLLSCEWRVTVFQ